ncbi:MAG: CHAT domain-containing protein [Polyangiaceae bacterium]|nr:CHAT domain-containing protein [Polyangiaceae bacterium]
MRSKMFRTIFLALSLLVPPVSSAHAAPPPKAPADANWYKDALDLHQRALQELMRHEVDSAIAKLDKALAISEANKSNEYVLLTLGYLINAYTMKRDTIKVEELFDRKLELSERTYGPKSTMFAMVLNDCGDFYRQLGQFERAQPMLERALAIHSGSTGFAAMGEVAPLNNLSNLHIARGELDKAAELLERALRIQEGLLGKEHMQIAPTLSNLAVVAHHRGDLERAEEIDRRACGMIETAAPNSFSYAQCIANLGYVLQSKGELTQAKELIEKSIKIQRGALGESHPRISLTRTALGHVHQSMGDIAAAVNIYDEAIAANDRDLDMVMVAGSESQKRDFFSRIAKQTEGVVSLHLTVAPKDPAARTLALRTILRRKGKVLDAVSQNISSLRKRMSDADAELLDQLLAARADLARAVLGGVGAPPPGSPEQKRRVDDARARIDGLEKDLAKRSAEFRARGDAVTIEKVQASLSQSSALVEFIRFNPYNPNWKKRDEAWSPARYAAYVVMPSGDPEAFDLGPADAIDAKVKEFRTACADSSRTDAPLLAKALDETLLRPIMKTINALPPPPSGKPRMIFLSPDAGLNLVPFGALVDETGRHRIETFAFDYITTGRDLLRFSEEAPAPRQRSFVLANPDFGPRQPKGKVQTRFAVYFPPLPGTIEEGRVIAALLPGSTLVTETKAIERTIKDLSGPEALHMATHGFFWGEPKSMEGNTRALELEMSNVANTGSGPKTLQVPVENPLLRSGLAMAGANRREGAEDGLLTALEASGMDLWGTKLVVLSACETGLGDVAAGEGVYGLRRALSMAGAQTTLMSLWQVDDLATRDLMIKYYHQLAAGEGRVDALRTSQLALLHGKGRKHPFYWAAFVVSGDFRPVPFAIVPPGGIPPPVNPGAKGCACHVADHDQPNHVWALLLALTALARRRHHPRRFINHH